MRCLSRLKAMNSPRNLCLIAGPFCPAALASPSGTRASFDASSWADAAREQTQFEAERIRADVERFFPARNFCGRSPPQVCRWPMWPVCSKGARFDRALVCPPIVCPPFKLHGARPITIVRPDRSHFALTDGNIYQRGQAKCAMTN